LGQRRRARECALQMLFQMDVAGGPPEEVFSQYWTDQQAPPDLRSFAEDLVRGVARERVFLDNVVAGSAEHWRVARMAVVDRNVLRMAVYEMLYDPEVPPVVAIDEAIEVARKFGSEESGAFINGILDAVRKRIERGEITPRRDGR
jgi:N utilization substance protein B